MEFLTEIIGFFAKTAVITLALVIILSVTVALLSKGKFKHEKVMIKKLNKKLKETQAMMQEEVLSKKQLKQQRKEAKQHKKEAENTEEGKKRIFVIEFDGDMRASDVRELRESITAILSIATTADEIVVCVESGGGMVHAYGLAASQLQRIRQRNIPLTVIIDKVAASGGYLMACVANRIIAAPFAIVGSIGVLAQIPNFNRYLKKHNIDFEQLSAGEYKRTLSMFGENTDKARDKMQQELEEIHGQFKTFIKEYRPQLDLNQVATGEHWLAMQAKDMQLVDELSTSDDYLTAACSHADVYTVSLERKKSLSDKLSHAVRLCLQQFRFKV
jgi:serine protease SohB